MKKTQRILCSVCCLVCALLTNTAAQQSNTQSGTQAKPRRRATARPSELPPRSSLKLNESAEALTIQMPDYTVTVTREGFGLTIKRDGDTVLQTAQAGDEISNLSFVRNNAPQHLTRLHLMKQGADSLSLEYETTAKDTVARVELRPRARALNVTVSLLNSDATLAPNLKIKLSPSGFWYGGGFQGWKDPNVLPLNEAHIQRNGFFAQGSTQGTPIWYSTKGSGIWVRTPHDFRYSINGAPGARSDNLLTVEMPGVSALSYDILINKNIREVVRQIINEVGYPQAVPPADYFRLPIYTTWVEHKVPVSQAKVLEFARQIHAHNLPCGVIEIDDKWEDKYGDMKFDAAKFPNPKAMVDELHRLGYRVTLWVHPFVNTDSETYRQHRTDGLLLQNLSRDAGLIKWWNGVAAVWDYSNPRAGVEFRSRLARLQQQDGFDGFKFDGGDVNLVPQDMRAATGITPVDYADVYNRETTARYPWSETRVGIYSQKLGVVQRLIDKHSIWGPENGLAALVPEAITSSLRGFPFVMPDMIGGNQYDNDVIDKELLVRWAQASALMPLMQFSVGPWHFDEETVKLSRDAGELHIKFAPYITNLARQTPRNGEPILAPLWYHYPMDREAQQINDQFMLGPDVIVAPVVKKGATSRDLYLPEGRWRDLKTGEETKGARWVRSYSAPLDTLPVFIRSGARVL